MNQFWNIINWALKNKLQWIFNRSSNIFKNTFENFICRSLSISSWPQCVKQIKLRINILTLYAAMAGPADGLAARGANLFAATVMKKLISRICNGHDQIFQHYENVINSLSPRRNGYFQTYFPQWLDEFVNKGSINNIPTLVQKMAWRRADDKPLSGPLKISLPTLICVTHSRWVKWLTRPRIWTNKWIFMILEP